MVLSFVSISTTRSSKSSLYSTMSLGLRSTCAAIRVPPPFLVLIASKEMKSGNLSLPFLRKCVSCTVTKFAPVFITSDFRLSIFPFPSPAAFVENIFRIL